MTSASFRTARDWNCFGGLDTHPMRVRPPSPCDSIAGRNQVMCSQVCVQLKECLNNAGQMHTEIGCLSYSSRCAASK